MLSMSGRLSAKRWRLRCRLPYWDWVRQRFRSPIPLQTSSLRLSKPKTQQARFTRKIKHRQARRLYSRLLHPMATLRLTQRPKSMSLRITPWHRRRRKTYPALFRRTRCPRLRLATTSQATRKMRRPKVLAQLCPRLMPLLARALPIPPMPLRRIARALSNARLMSVSLRFLVRLA